MKLFIFFLLMLSSALLFSSKEDEKKLEDIEKQSQEQYFHLQKAMIGIDSLIKLQELDSNKKKGNCFNVFPNESFCACLADNLPFCVGITEYVAILNYEQRSDDDYELGFYWLEHCQTEAVVRSRYENLSEVERFKLLLSDGEKLQKKLETARNKCLSELKKRQ